MVGPQPITIGQELLVRIVRPGDRPRQGIGFLADGSFVVVERGIFALGREINVKVTGLLTTQRGRMVSGEPSDAQVSPRK